MSVSISPICLYMHVPYIAAINQIVQYQLLVINFENKVYKIFKCKTVIGPNKGNKNTNTTSVGLILHSYIMLY